MSPQRDGTGPAGKGPRTGRKAGPCKPKKKKEKTKTCSIFQMHWKQ